MRWNFLGGADMVTGSKHVLEINGAHILVDCGLFQGRRAEAEERNKNLGFPASSIDAMLLSHAHIDHCGNIPMLVKQGYRNPIYTTTATADLLPIMLRDSAHIQEADAAYLNQKTSRKGLPQVSPLYTMADAEAVFPLLKPFRYDTPIALPGGATATLVDAGHILGAALTCLEVPQKDGSTLRVAYTVDLGRHNLPLLQDPVQLTNIDVLITESTYGNRLHDNAKNARDDLGVAINKAISRGGKVIIPTFALERAQEIIYHIAVLRDQNKIAPVPVFVDSPMAQAITGVFEKHHDYLDEEHKNYRSRIGSVISPSWLTFTPTIDESKAITSSQEPSIVLAASGMCEHGRIRHHLKHGIENPKNIVILVGYQAVNTLGRKLQNGDKHIKIFGDDFTVHAEIETLNAFSAHADRLELYQYIRTMRPKKIFLVHGEEEQRESFAQLVREQLKINTILPMAGQGFEL